MNNEIKENITDANELINIAYRYAMRLISMRNYSYKKLLNKLIEKNHGKEISKLAINKLNNEGFYKEEYFTNSFVRSLIKKGNSLDLVKRSLQHEGIQLTIAELKEKSAELTNEKYSEIKQIEDLINKKQNLLLKWATLEKNEKYQAEQKMMRFLVSKGHQFDACKTAIKNYIQTNLTTKDCDDI